MTCSLEECRYTSWLNVASSSLVLRGIGGSAVLSPPLGEQVGHGDGGEQKGIYGDLQYQQKKTASEKHILWPPSALQIPGNFSETDSLIKALLSCSKETVSLSRGQWKDSAHCGEVGEFQAPPRKQQWMAFPSLCSSGSLKANYACSGVSP